MAIEITDEMRAAVHAEDCERLGHAPNFRPMMGHSHGPRMEIGSPDPEKLPHVLCDRCGRVWLLVEDTGTDYADAVTRYRSRLSTEEKAVFDRRAAERSAPASPPPDGQVQTTTRPR